MLPGYDFLSETMMVGKVVECLKWRLGFTHALGVNSRSRSGGLCLFWKGDIDFRVLESSEHHIWGNFGKGTGLYGVSVAFMDGQTLEKNTKLGTLSARFAVKL